MTIATPAADRTSRDVAWSIGLFGAAAVLLLLVLLATRAGASWFDDAPVIALAGADLQLVRGAGEVQGTSLVLQPAKDGLAIVAIPAANAALVADARPRVEWRLRAAQPPQDIAFVWRTREDPSRTHARPLQWTVAGPAPLELGADEGWQGTITGMALVVRGTITTPLEVLGVRVPSGSAKATLQTLFAQWDTYFPLQGYAVAFPFDSERGHVLPLAQAIAIVVGLALLIAVGIARWRNATVNATVIWLTLALGWIVLDVRWQANLWRTAFAAHDRYAGKDMEAKWEASDDAAVHALARDVLALLPPPPARVVILADNTLLAVRLGHFLSPHNVYAPLKRVRSPADPHRGVPDHADLRSGDYVLLFFDSALGYDPERRLLQWPDGHVLPVTPLLARPNTLLLRVP